MDEAGRHAERILHETTEWVPVTDLDAFVDSLMAELFGPDWDEETP